MNAKELRAISDKANYNKAKNFWEAYNANLFALLERRAESGDRVVKIDTTLVGYNPHNWLSDPDLYKKVIAELKIRELDVTHIWNHDRSEAHIIIKW